MSDDTPTHDEDELRRQLHRLGSAMEAAAAHDPHKVIALDGGGTRLRRPRRLIAAGAGVAVAAALVIGLVAMRSPAHQPLAATRTAGSGSSTTAPATQTVVPMADLIGFLMPATSTEYNDGTATALGDFSTTAAMNQSASCMRTRGWSEQVVSYFAHYQDRPRGPVPMSNRQFPDVARLETGIFSENDGSTVQSRQATRDAAIPKDRQDAAFSALRACSTTAGSETSSDLGRLLTTGIGRTVQGAYDFEGGMTVDPTYVAALANWESCMADGGEQTTSLDDFFGQVDNVQRSNLGDAPKAARTAELAKLYGRCVEPLSKVTDAYRLAARDRVVAKYQTQLDELLTQVNQEVVELEAQYGITYP